MCIGSPPSTLCFSSMYLVLPIHYSFEAEGLPRLYPVKILTTSTKACVCRKTVEKYIWRKFYEELPFSIRFLLSVSLRDRLRRGGKAFAVSIELQCVVSGTNVASQSILRRQEYILFFHIVDSGMLFFFFEFFFSLSDSRLRAIFMKSRGASVFHVAARLPVQYQLSGSAANKRWPGICVKCCKLLFRGRET